MTSSNKENIINTRSVVNTKNTDTENVSGIHTHVSKKIIIQVSKAAVPLISGLGLGLGLASSLIDIPPTVPPLSIPQVNHIINYFTKKLASLRGNQELFCADQYVKYMAKLLTIYHDVK